MAGPLDTNIGTASNIANILQMLVGKRGGTESQQTISSGGFETRQTGVNAADIMTQILGATGKYYGGATLADLASGKKRAGLYGGSTGMNEQRFLTQAATEAAVAAAPVISTKSPTSSDIRTVGKGSQAGMLSGSGLGMGALALLAGSKAGRKKVGDMWDDIFGTSVTDTAAGGGAVDTFANSVGGTTNSAADAQFFRDFGGSGSGFQSTSYDAGAAYDAGASAYTYSDMLPGAEIVGGGFAAGGSDMIAGFEDYASVADAADAAAGADALSFADAGDGIPYLSTALNVAEGDWTGAALSGIGYAVGGPIGGVVGNLVSNVIGDDCFITTATLRALGEDTGDTSPQLTTLRHYRDTWLLANHPEDIAEYYRIAPAIVLAINAREDSDQIWATLWQSHLSPALTLIAAGKNEEAYQQYRDMVEVATTWSKD